MPSIPSIRLTDDNLAKVDEFLNSIDGGMVLEEVDGFFCALIAGPDTVMPSEYLPYVFGGEIPDIGPGTQASEVLQLVLQHWNFIVDSLSRNQIYLPILGRDENGNKPANFWADGFMQGVELRRESWQQLIDDIEYGGMMDPVMTLHLEHSYAAKSAPIIISDDERKELIDNMTFAILDAYIFFTPQRKQKFQRPSH